MYILINGFNSIYDLPLVNPLFSLLLIPLIGFLFFRAFRRDRLDSKNTGSEFENFRISIKAYPNESVRVGLYISEELSSDEIGDILMTALPVIGKKDPDTLRLLLLHCLNAFDNDEKMNKVLNKFCKSLS